MAKITKISPFAPAALAVLPPIAGVTLAAGETEAGYRGRDNLMLAVLQPGTAVAGALTRSLTSSAPVHWCRKHLTAGRARALVVNSGNSNAFTGKQGDDTAQRTAEAAAKALGCDASEVFLASTGVIAQPLPAEPFETHLPRLAGELAADSWHQVARAICTTDTFTKVATRTVEVAGTTITINGIAKGSGMIAPDMATMLAFVFTDAKISSPALQALTTAACTRTFNAITVDSDTSTSDTLLVFATGASAERGAPDLDSDTGARGQFATILHDLMHDLAQQIVTDGEGISKLIEVQVTGAKTDGSARKIARAIADSPLVKTAIAGADANWGRVVMAVGKAGEPADRDRLSIRFGDVEMAKNGERVPGYDETAATAYMQGSKIVIAVDIGLGDGEGTIWGCDLTHEYIAINADYRS